MTGAAAAMIVVEMQRDLVAPELASRRGLAGALSRAVAERGVIPRLSALLSSLRAAGVPVLYANKERDPAAPLPAHIPIYARAGSEPILVAGTPGAGVVEALAPQPGDVVLRRLTGLDPSADENLWRTLKGLGAAALIVAGVSTTIAVEGFVRGAANRGYRTIVAEDCCASVPSEWHEFSVRNVLPLLAEVVAAGAVPAALGRPDRPVRA